MLVSIMWEHISDQPWSLFTNAAFLLSALFAWIFTHEILAATALLVFFISSRYHAIKNPGPDAWASAHAQHKRTPGQVRWLWIDTVAAWLLTAVVVWVFAAKDWPYQFWMALGLMALGTYLFIQPGDNYDFRHGIWHMTAALAIVLAVIA